MYICCVNPTSGQDAREAQKNAIKSNHEVEIARLAG